MELNDGSTTTDLLEYVQALEAKVTHLERIVVAVERYRSSLPYADAHIRNNLLACLHGVL